MKWNEEKCKKEFINAINEITDVKLSKICLGMVDKLPKYFWVIPASSSGKYHPDCDLGQGGLVRHSLMVKKCALDLLLTKMFVPNNDEYRDYAIVCALFHDAFKSGKVEAEADGTVFDHPILSSFFVAEELSKGGIPYDKVKIIERAIACHMGIWNTSNYSNCVLPLPHSDFDKLIHTADFVASRKYIKWIEDNE